MLQADLYRCRYPLTMEPLCETCALCWDRSFEFAFPQDLGKGKSLSVGRREKKRGEKGMKENTNEKVGRREGETAGAEPKGNEQTWVTVPKGNSFKPGEKKYQPH